MQCCCAAATRAHHARLHATHTLLFLVACLATNTCAQVLEEWDASEYGRQLDVIEAGLTVAVQDALGDTRASGRAGFAAYASAVPDRAAALLRRLDGGLQAKLNDALAAYARGGTAAALARPGAQCAVSACMHATDAACMAGSALTCLHIVHMPAPASFSLGLIAARQPPARAQALARGSSSRSSSQA